MGHGLKSGTRNYRNRTGWLLSWNSSDDPFGCLSLEKGESDGTAVGKPWEDGNRTGVPLTTIVPRRTSLSPGSGRVPGDLYTAKSSPPAWSTSSGSGPVGRVSRHARPPFGSVFLRISSAVTVVIRSR